MIEPAEPPQPPPPPSVLPYAGPRTRERGKLPVVWTRDRELTFRLGRIIAAGMALAGAAFYLIAWTVKSEGIGSVMLIFGGIYMAPGAVLWSCTNRLRTTPAKAAPLILLVDAILIAILQSLNAIGAIYLFLQDDLGTSGAGVQAAASVLFAAGAIKLAYHAHRTLTRPPLMQARPLDDIREWSAGATPAAIAQRLPAWALGTAIVTAVVNLLVIAMTLTALVQIPAAPSTAAAAATATATPNVPTGPVPYKHDLYGPRGIDQQHRTPILDRQDVVRDDVDALLREIGGRMPTSADGRPTRSASFEPQYGNTQYTENGRVVTRYVNGFTVDEESHEVHWSYRTIQEALDALDRRMGGHLTEQQAQRLALLIRSLPIDKIEFSQSQGSNLTIPFGTERMLDDGALEIGFQNKTRWIAPDGTIDGQTDPSPPRAARAAVMPRRESRWPLLALGMCCVAALGSAGWLVLLARPTQLAARRAVRIESVRYYRSFRLALTAISCPLGIWCVIETFRCHGYLATDVDLIAAILLAIAELAFAGVWFPLALTKAAKMLSPPPVPGG